MNIYKSTNGGNSWSGIYYSPSDPNGNNPAAFLAPFALSQSNTSVLYAGNTTLLKTSNSGSSWTDNLPDPIDNDNHILSIAISPTSADTVYFATAPTDGNPMHAYITTDGGFTYSDITNGLPNRYLRRMAVHPDDSRIVYAVFGGFGSAHVYKTTNAGTSWTDVSSGLPDLPFHSIVIDPLAPNHIYAGSDFSCYSSLDGGQSWSTFADGLPEAVMIFDLQISPFDRTLYAFTHGHGAYKTDLIDVNLNSDQGNSAFSIQLFPALATTNCAVLIQSAVSGRASLQVLNSDGKKVMEMNNEEIQKGITTIDWNVEHWPAGAYFALVQIDNYRQVKKFVVVK
jgi:hypothetical protein